MKNYIPILVLSLLSYANSIAQTFSNDNFIYSATPQKAVQAANYNTLTKSEITQSVTYFDGLGRPIQSIAIGQGGDSSDIVTHMEYDAFGRQVKDYLPYSVTNVGNEYLKTNALTATNSFYSTSKYENTVNPFSEKLFESSPLNRVLQQAAPGNDWAMANNHTIKLDYQTNSASEVKNFGVSLVFANNTYNPTLTLSTVNQGFYNANELYKTITFDENTTGTLSESAGSTVEFKNKEGQVVLKRTYGIVGNETVNKAHDTYYVYDNYGNLTYVLPPLVEPNTATLSVINSSLNDLCYQYKYDYRNRLVEKKIPGKQWEFIVYDKLDRPVATGPASSPFNDLTTVGWLITKYDAFSRPVYTGWMTSTAATSLGRISLQTAQNSATVLNESKQTSGTIDGVAAYYSNVIAPTAFKLLTVNYYDNYTFPDVPVIPITVETQTVLTTAKVKSLPTGSWTRVLTSNSSLLGETATTFYDAKARPIRSYNKNYLGGYTYTDSKLDFTGKPENSKTYHKRLNSDAELKTTDVFVYSSQGRLLTQTHQIGTGTVELIASNSYDELGQLISKKVGNNTTAPVQKVDYTYNIRGWLKGINDITSLTKSGDPIDLFAFRINYNTIPSGIPNVKALYNGNIAETQWATNSDAGILRAYGYKYDDLNRLKEGIYKKGTTFSNAYNETLTYDKNGNIKTLLRNGNNETVTQIDNLTYLYGASNTNNQLLRVNDSSNKAVGFIDGDNIGDDYTYDANGNMTTDANKNITAIVYNHLNLPAKITFASTGNITYIYTAAGQKLQKIVTQGTNITTTDYLGGYQYKNNVLQFFPTAEGYVEPSGSSYKYVYQYKDHLGNVRLSYDKTLAIQEENNYYPFGLKQEGYNIVKNSTNDALKYKYNGKELQDELGLNLYDYGARNYDPAIGRWINPDALSEEYSDYSPYVYAFNDPVRHIDPDGNAPEDRLGEIDPPGKKQSAASAGTIKLLPVQKYQGGYVGQGLDELVTAGIQWLGGQISGSDVSKETSENVQLATSLLVVIVSKGKNAKADGEVVEQLTKAETRAAKLSEKARPSEKFTKAGKEAVVDVNKAKNGGKTVCEGCKTNTTPATQSKKGVTPSKTETQVDHVVPKSKGGSGTPNNGQVLCRDCNIKKSNN